MDDVSDYSNILTRQLRLSDAKHWMLALHDTCDTVLMINKQLHAEDLSGHIRLCGRMLKVLNFMIGVEF